MHNNKVFHFIADLEFSKRFQTYDAGLLFNYYLRNFTVPAYQMFIITVSVKVIFMLFVTTLCHSIFHARNVRVQFTDLTSEWFIYDVYFQPGAFFSRSTLKNIKP